MEATPPNSVVPLVSSIRREASVDRSSTETDVNHGLTPMICHRCAAAASCTAAMIGSQSAPGWRVTVTKSLTPNTDATPPAANTSRANAMAIACSALVALNIAGNLVSKVNFVASGFGVDEGVAVATTRS